MIRLNYDRLSLQLQELFMDVALFRPSMYSEESSEYDYFNWLSLVHRQRLEDTLNQLQQLRERGLVEDVDISSGRVSIHDLYKEFAEMEAEGKLSSSVGFKRRRWVYCRGSYPSDLERTPSGRCWQNLIRVGMVIWDVYLGAVSNLHEIQWRYCSNLVVLKLDVSVETSGVLNLEGLRCLRSLELRGSNESDGMLEVMGMEDLNSLRYLCWAGGYTHKLHGSAYLRQLPASLEILYLHEVGVRLRSEVFDCCRNLRLLSLDHIRGSDIMDLRHCSSLRRVKLECISGLQKLLGLAAESVPLLRSLEIGACEDLSDVSGLGDLVRLDRLVVYDNPLLEELPDLQKLTSLQFLKIGGLFYGAAKGICKIADVRGLGVLQQLRELHCCGLDATELPNLSALEHLHVLYLSWCEKLTTLEGVAGLTALRRVELRKCSSLSRLPDLSNSTKLEKLELSASGIELHEEDIDMLAALPGLRRVDIGLFIQLDPVRRKVVKKDSVDGRVVEAESNLESLPIKVLTSRF